MLPRYSRATNLKSAQEELTELIHSRISRNCRYLGHLVSIAAAFSVVVSGAVLTCEKVEAKAKKKSSQHRKNRKISGHNFLVPPPPPYAPSIMPELHMMANRGLPKQAKKEAPKDEYPYSKYIYTAKKADAPRSVKLNHTTTVWN